MVPYGFSVLLLLCIATAAGVMDVEYSWVYVDYTFSSPQHRDAAIKTGRFIPENCVILDVDVFQGTSEEKLYYNSGATSSSTPKRRVFVTIPRIKPGNPATVAEIVPGDRPGTIQLSPFPNWKANIVLEDRLNCDDTIVSVFRTKIDDLGRFWVLDAGTLDQFELTARSVCPPKLLVFDLKNGDKLIKMYTFPTTQLRDISLLTNIVVDIRDPKGRNTYAYISDTTAYKLIVYDFRNHDSWVVDQAYFYPYPNKAHFNINGVEFDLMDGLIGLALGPFTKNDRKLYFHSFASTRESWVYTSVVQNKSIFQNGLVDGTGTFFVSSEVRDIQSSVEVMTDDGILISASMDNSLVCWNSQDTFTSKNLYTIYKSNEDFQFPSGMKIVGDKVWAVSCQLQNHFTSAAMNRKSIKYRVLVGRIDELIKGTGCDKRTKFDEDDDEFLIESFDGNMLREWRAVPDSPWSYSRMSRVFEDNDSAQPTPKKSVAVVTGNVNLHSASESKSVVYDCRLSMVDGRLTNRNCLGRTRRKLKKKRTASGGPQLRR